MALEERYTVNAVQVVLDGVERPTLKADKRRVAVALVPLAAGASQYYFFRCQNGQLALIPVGLAAPLLLRMEDYGPLPALDQGVSEVQLPAGMTVIEVIDNDAVR